MRHAQLSDVGELLSLRESAAAWMHRQGIEQWDPGEVSWADVRRQVLAGEWWLACHDAGAAVALRLLWSDVEVWDRPVEGAAYVHGLVIDRDRAGSGLGVGALTWAARQARAAGHGLLRLDCVESNGRLRRYYREQGFREVGRKRHDDGLRPAVLLEKRLT